MRETWQLSASLGGGGSQTRAVLSGAVLELEAAVRLQKKPGARPGLAFGSQHVLTGLHGIGRGKHIAGLEGRLLVDETRGVGTARADL